MIYGDPTVAPGNIGVVTVRVPLPPLGRMVRPNGPLTCCAGIELSVTLTVRFDIPAAAGVPLTVQLSAVRLNPAGNNPESIAHVYGVTPPVTPITSLYGVPTTPFGNTGVVSVNEPGVTTVTLNGPLTLCCGVELSVTCTVRAAVPAATGVPLTVHVLPVSVRPAGSVPLVMLHRYGPVPPATPITSL